ncbi:translation machinery-associated protein 16 [Phialemonium atrogriseum]|uniref:Translation machinery-associated protein 16 n=1 Tax=Phialemonium atrogriseum TaxID=1093897 RepID=A0AAJ0BXW9_9PEZI|nr:translation machinery-associated protein 16 [Phialemonium atrogriseum]KAK1766523.1 translation machinery-associated protein 16 [Phialemonium atrogriseum]
MAKTLEKTRKQISKKRNGVVDSLHEFSRDSRRLRRALLRDERLEKMAGSRKKNNKPLLERASFFQRAIRENDGRPLQIEAVQSKIQEFIHQYDEEYETITKARRAGRGASAREDLLKAKISSLEKEYQNGFFLPDLTTVENVPLLDRWEGTWSYLTNVTWVRVNTSGNVQPSSFPPRN